MVTQTATVIDSRNNQILVEIKNSSSCSSCSNSTCSSSVLSELFRTKPIQLPLINTISAQVDDVVTISLSDRALLLASLYGYLLPLLTMIIAVVIAQTVAWSETVQVFLACGGFAVGLSLVKAITSWHHYYFKPDLLGIVIPQQPIYFTHTNEDYSHE